jgi:excisionase family DNA binding protein
MERMYSVDEAAELLTLSHWTIRSWLNTGKLRGTRVGVRRVIRESELKKLIVDDPRRPQTSGAKTRRHASA